MEKIKKFFLLLMALSLIFASCSGSLSNQLRKEMQEIKNQCPQYQGSGVTMTNANFYEHEKVLEYVASIEGVYIDDIDAYTIEIMKEAIIEELSSGSDISVFEKFSIKAILEKDYRLRYVYTDTEGFILCKIEITKYDLR
jgi:hypothetical protein